MIHFDIDNVKTYLGSDKIVLQGFLALVKKELMRSFADIGGGIREKNLKVLKDAGHKLKGTGLSGGMPGITLIATSINKLIIFDETEIEVLFTQLKNEIDHILPLLDKEIEALA